MSEADLSTLIDEAIDEMKTQIEDNIQEGLKTAFYGALDKTVLFGGDIDPIWCEFLRLLTGEEV